MTERLKVCVAGAGFFSQFHCDAWQRLEEVDLVALCDRDAGAARAAAEKYGIGRDYTDVMEMLDAEKPDLFDIVTPPPAHRLCIDATIERNIAAICQKPFCGTMEAAKSAVAAIEKAGATVIVHENFRFQPWYARIRQTIEEGLLGDIYQATFRLRPGDGQGAGAYLDRQPYFRKMERFLIHETAIHQIDVFRYLLGEPTHVFARLERLNPAIAGEDAGIILLDFGNGARALFDGNRLSDHAADNRRLTMGEFWLEGSKGVLRMDGWARLRFRAHGGNDEMSIEYPWDNRGFGGDCVCRLQAHVVDHMLRGAALHNTARDYLANLHIEESAYLSNAEGRIRALHGAEL